MIFSPVRTGAGVRQDPLFHTILATDVAKSGGRDDNLILRMRAGLREMLSSALSRQHIDIAKVTTLDDGDGFRLLLPADVPPHVLLDPFLSRLGIELREQRDAASAANRLRLRVALHSGLLFREPSGAYAGTPLKDCARLLDAPAGRKLLEENPGADMVVLLTEVFHRDVVAGGTSLDPAWFRRIPIRVKETDQHGWAYVPGVPPESPAPAAARKPKPKPKRKKSDSSVAIDMRDNSSINTVVGGDYHG
jgi:hypothetical protein